MLTAQLFPVNNSFTYLSSESLLAGGDLPTALVQKLANKNGGAHTICSCVENSNFLLLIIKP